MNGKRKTEFQEVLVNVRVLHLKHCVAGARAVFFSAVSILDLRSIRLPARRPHFGATGVPRLINRELKQ